MTATTTRPFRSLCGSASGFLLALFLALSAPLASSANVPDVNLPRLEAIFNEQLLILEQLSEQLQRQSQELERLRRSLIANERLVSDSQEVIANSEKLIESLQNEIDSSEQRVIGLQNQLDNSQQITDESQKLIADSERIISDLRNTISSLESGLNRRQILLNELSAELATAQDSQRDSLTSLVKADQSLQEMERKLVSDRVLFGLGGAVVGAGITALLIVLFGS